MVVAVSLILLGLLTQVVVFSASRFVRPHFTQVCTKCGYHIPIMEYPPVLTECPGCHWMNQTLSEAIASKQK